MIKNILPALILTLTGCSALQVFSYDSLPVVRATVTQGATKSSVISAAGMPDSEILIKSNQNTCLNYTLRKDNKTTPFFIIVNSRNQVTNYGYVSCGTAIEEGHAAPTEPMKQRL